MIYYPIPYWLFPIGYTCICFVYFCFLSPSPHPTPAAGSCRGAQATESLLQGDGAIESATTYDIWQGDEGIANKE